MRKLSLCTLSVRRCARTPGMILRLWRVHCCDAEIWSHSLLPATVSGVGAPGIFFSLFFFWKQRSLWSFWVISSLSSAFFAQRPSCHLRHLIRASLPTPFDTGALLCVGPFWQGVEAGVGSLPLVLNLSSLRGVTELLRDLKSVDCQSGGLHYIYLRCSAGGMVGSVFTAPLRLLKVSCLGV